MKNILVPTDFSENAIKASEYAAGIANRSGATIHLVHACSLLENKSGNQKSLRAFYNEAEIEKKKSELIYHHQVLTEKYTSIAAEYHLFKGPAEDVLLHYCQNHEIDLVVMGTQGASGIEGVIFGSVTSSFMGKSPVPVLAIPSGYAGLSPENILLATQKFEQDKRILEPVFEMAALYDVPVHIFAFENDSDSDIAIAESTLKLGNYLEYLQKTYPLARVKATLNKGDSFEEAMEEYSIENHSGIISMATHKRGFFGQIFNPSLTKKMAYHSSVPLLSIPVNN